MESSGEVEDGAAKGWGGMFVFITCLHNLSSIAYSKIRAHTETDRSKNEHKGKDNDAASVKHFSMKTSMINDNKLRIAKSLNHLFRYNYN